MTPLWNSHAIAAATEGAATAGFAASGVSIDSRTLAAGDLFVALTGPNFDGHDYLEGARRRGAAGALVARPADSALPQVIVQDTHRALRALARAARRRARARVVAITGSVGKTGTKAMCARVLATAGRVHTDDASLNNHIGLPLTLSRLDPACDFAVLEMGMNRPGKIRALSGIGRPDIAVITTIAPAHMEFFPDLSAIAAAKAEIFDGVPGYGGAVLNRDAPCHGALVEAARARAYRGVMSFGAAAACDARLLDFSPHPHGSHVRVCVAGREFAYRLRLQGRHWAHNSLAVLAVAHLLGLDVTAGGIALEGLDGLPGRGRRFRVPCPDGGRAEVIDDAYNASPASMAAAFDVLATAEGRRLAVLGDMLELGASSVREHASLAATADRAGIDRVFTAGAADGGTACAPARRAARRACGLGQGPGAARARLAARRRYGSGERLAWFRHARDRRCSRGVERVRASRETGGSACCIISCRHWPKSMRS